MAHRAIEREREREGERERERERESTQRLAFVLASSSAFTVAKLASVSLTCKEGSVEHRERGCE